MEVSIQQMLCHGGTLQVGDSMRQPSEKDFERGKRIMESCCPEVLALLHNWDYCLTRSTKREATFEDRWGDTQVVIMPDHRWKFIRRNVPPEHGEAIEKLDRLMAIHQLSMSEPDGRRERTKRIMKGHLSPFCQECHREYPLSPDRTLKRNLDGDFLYPREVDWDFLYPLEWLDPWVRARRGDGVLRWRSIINWFKMRAKPVEQNHKSKYICGHCYNMMTLD